MPSALENAALAWRRRLLAAERAPLARMAAIYREAAVALQAEIDRYTARIAQGDPLTPTLIYRRQAAREAQAEVERLLRNAAERAAQETAQLQAQAVNSAFASVQEMAAVQDAQVAGFLRRPNSRAVEALVGNASDGSPLRAVFMDATGGQAEALTTLLARNVALGVNPQVTARQMRAQLGVLLERARTIARTETLRAQRVASQETMLANEDVLDGYIRVEACDARTCAACWALHGRFYRLNEPPDEHPNGRMVMAPHVKGSTAAVTPGPERFAGLGAATQRRVLGPAAYEAYRDGALQLGDMVGRRQSERWGGSIYVRSLRGVVGAERAAGYVERAKMSDDPQNA